MMDRTPGEKRQPPRGRVAAVLFLALAATVAAESATAQPVPGTGAGAGEPAASRAPKRGAGAPAATAIRCEGPFARTATHDALAGAFGADNVDFTRIDGPEGTKLDATVIYPNDPKRRVEVLWHDDGARARPSAVIVSGRSAWVGPKGVRVGSTLADVEKANGKPFKLSGFDIDGGGAVSDWQNGAFSKLPGDCGLSVRFEPGTAAPENARGKVSGEGPFSSADPSMRAAKPRVVEFFIGYGE